nr:MAG TPA: hypothetical protein [Caudoviricetes sp.]
MTHAISKQSVLFQWVCYAKTIREQRKPPKSKGERKCQNTFTPKTYNTN